MGCLEAERLEIKIVDQLGNCRYCGKPVTSENGYACYYVSSWDMETCYGVFHNEGNCREAI